jgi:hypothetical protein
VHIRGSWTRYGFTGISTDIVFGVNVCDEDDEKSDEKKEGGMSCFISDFRVYVVEALFMYFIKFSYIFAFIDYM